MDYLKNNVITKGITYMFTLQTKISMAKAILTKNSPFYIQFFVSKHCHLNCKMCNIVEANNDLVPFDEEKITNIAENLVKIGAGVVLLTGGEPFLRPDIDLIVKIFTQKKLDIRLQTAGLIEKKDSIRNCVENGARNINISLDSLDEELSDYINGVKGSWRKALQTISFVSRTFPVKDSVCALGCVLSAYNLDEIEPILEFATRIGWWLSLVPVHISDPSRPLSFRGYDKYFAINEDDHFKLYSLIGRLKNLKRQGLNLFDSDDYLDSIYHFVKTGHPTWRHKGICDSPNLYFAILPDGSFAPCCDHRFPEKNYVYDKEFPSIYFSNNFRRRVTDITQQCSGCNFGSYPEMTLFARSISTIKERVLLQLKSGTKSIVPLEEKEIFEIVSEVKSKYPIYSSKLEYKSRENKMLIPAVRLP